MKAQEGTRVTAQSLIALRHVVLENRHSDNRITALSGEFATKKPGQGQVNADSRAYVQGDDMRYLDRGATARTGMLHVRTFHEERDRITFLVADFRPSMLWGMHRALRSVAAAEALAWLGWQAVEAGGRVGLLAVSAGEQQIVRIRGGTRGMLAVIGGLVRAHDAAMDMALAEPGRLIDPMLDTALAGLHHIVPRGSTVAIASALDRLGGKFDHVIGQLSRTRTAKFILIEDGALRNLPKGHYPILGADGHRRMGQFRNPISPQLNTAVLKGYQVMRVDAGLPPSRAMIQAGAA